MQQYSSVLDTVLDPIVMDIRRNLPAVTAFYSTIDPCRLVMGALFRGIYPSIPLAICCKPTIKESLHRLRFRIMARTSVK